MKTGKDETYMSLFVKILTIVLWVIVICALVFTAFRFSWFAEWGMTVAKEAFDYDYNQLGFFNDLTQLILWLVIILAVVMLFQYIMFLIRSKKHYLSESELLERDEKREAKKRKHKNPDTEKIPETEDTTTENEVVKQPESSTPSTPTTDKERSAILRRMYYR